MASYLVWGVLLLAAYCKAEIIGTPVTIEEYPSIAQVEIGLAGILWTQQCAASIITSLHYLTLASCFEGSVEFRRIRAGTDIRSTGGVVIPAASSTNHPNSDADITVVRGTTPLVLGPTMAQIAILTQGFALPTGLGVQLVGWGTTAEGGEVSSSGLFSLNMFVTDRTTCAEQYLDETDVTENHICIGRTLLSGRDYDARDMGDPVYYQNILVGLLAYGRRDANDEFPIVCTSISSYTDWIIANAV